MPLMKGFSMKTISPALHFIQPWGIACNLALGMCLSFSAIVCAQNSAEHEKPALLMFLESLDCGSIPPVSIPSKERCEALPDDSQRESAQAARDFCEDALNKLSGVSCRDIQEPLAVIEKLSHLQSWCLKTPGYGNLLLAYAAEGRAVDLSLVALATGENRETARFLSSASFHDSIPFDFWVQSLASEGINIDSAQLPPRDEPEGVRLASLFQLLWDETSLENRLHCMPRAGDDFRKCFEEFAPARIGWLALQLSIREVSLSACLAIAENTNGIPHDKQQFLSAVREHAREILEREDRLGGKMFADQVWMVWMEALEKANGN